MAAGQGNIYLSSDQDHVIAYLAGSGEVIWSNEQLLRRNITAPQTLADYVAVADSEGYLHVMSQEDGRFVARKKIDGDGVRSAMISDGEVLYVMGNSGKLVALKVKEK